MALMAERLYMHVIFTWPVCACMHSDGGHNRRKHDSSPDTTKPICNFMYLRRIQKLPDDGRLLPKHVGASI
jgi:hypothetical protein